MDLIKEDSQKNEETQKQVGVEEKTQNNQIESVGNGSKVEKNTKKMSKISKDVKKTQILKISKNLEKEPKEDQIKQVNQEKTPNNTHIDSKPKAEELTKNQSKDKNQTSKEKSEKEEMLSKTKKKNTKSKRSPRDLEVMKDRNQLTADKENSVIEVQEKKVDIPEVF